MPKPTITVKQTYLGFVASRNQNGGTVEQLLPHWVKFDRIRNFMRNYFRAPFKSFNLQIID